MSVTAIKRKPRVAPNYPLLIHTDLKTLSFHAESKEELREGDVACGRMFVHSMAVRNDAVISDHVYSTTFT